VILDESVARLFPAVQLERIPIAAHRDIWQLAIPDAEGEAPVLTLPRYAGIENSTGSHMLLASRAPRALQSG
jgi:hypothetical protein